MSNVRTDTIRIGFQVFAAEGGEEFGAVRAVHAGGRAELTVYVENAGDFSVPYKAIKAVHDGKVVLDMKAVDPTLREAVRHAHDRETKGL
jgi:hypothetical protein